MGSPTITRVLHMGAIVLFGALMGFPLFYMFAAAWMTPSEITEFPPRILPGGFNWESYVQAYDYLSGRTIANSFIFSIGVVALQLLLGLPAGFALAKIRFPGATVLLVLFVVPMFLPNNITLIPLYVVTRELGMINSYAGLIIPVAGSTAFATLLFRQFFITLPDELIEAARIDGAGWIRTLGSIIVPLAGPATAAFCSISFLNAWHMFIWPMVVAPQPEYDVMTVALAPLAQGLDAPVPPNATMAAAALSTLPVLIAFLISQKWYVRGIVGTGAD